LSFSLLQLRVDRHNLIRPSQIHHSSVTFSAFTVYEYMTLTVTRSDARSRCDSSDWYSLRRVDFCP